VDYTGRPSPSVRVWGKVYRSFILLTEPKSSPTFPSTCLSPDQPGYGQVVASGPNRRRARRNTHATGLVHAPREAHANWTVVTPHSEEATRPAISPIQVSTNYTPMSFHQPMRDSHPRHSYPYPPPIDRSISSPAPKSPGGSATTSHVSAPRYSPYTGHCPPPRRRPSDEIRGPLSLDIPSQTFGDYEHGHNITSTMNHITLPPIRSTTVASNSQSPYALPPITALEDLRGLHTHDSAAVLRRLRSDEDSSYSEPGWSSRGSSSLNHRWVFH
jgi:hypothetical protein